MTPGSATPNREKILAAMERALRAEQFALSSRLSRFLRYVVTETVEGRSAALKEYAIGVSVYDRGTDFDPKTDSIVRVDAVKLRNRLSEYYAGSGATDEVRIAIPKGGYVATFVCNEADDKSIEIPRVEKRWKVVSALPMALAILAGLGLLGSGIRWRSVGEKHEVSLTPLTSYPGHEYRPSISRDGRYVAFGWTGSEAGKNFDIWLRPIDEDKPIRLTQHPNWDGAPEWSPSGEWIALKRRDVGTVIVNPITQAERVIGKEASYACHGWLPDGKKVLAAGEEGKLWALAVDGSGASEFASSPRFGARIHCGRASPDGKWLAVMTETDLFVRPLRGGEWVGLTPDHLKLRSFTWMPDSESLLYTGARQGDWTLWRISRKGGQPERAPGPGQGVWFVSAAESAVVFQQDIHDSNLVVIDPKDLSERRVHVSTKQEQDHRVSRDGSKVAFISDREGNRDLWVGSLDGSSLQRVTDLSGVWAEGPSWSADGREIAFYAVRDGNSDIYSVASTGGVARRLTYDASTESRPEWDPLGKWIYFASDRSGRFEVWRQSLQGGVAEQMTFDGGLYPHIDPEGKWLYYIWPAKLEVSSPDKGTLMRIPVSGGKPERIFGPIGMFQWSVSRQGVLCACPPESESDPHPDLLLIPLTGGKPKRVGKLPVPNMVLSVSVSESGNAIVLALLESVSEDLMLLRGLR
jgi:Tol biopolymer transport system component